MNGRFTVDCSGILKSSSMNGTTKSLMHGLLRLKSKEKHRPPALRPSSMPFCSIQLLRDLILKEPNEESMKSDFYMDVGTTLHSVVQKWLPRLGKGFGDWVCLDKKCGNKHKLTANRVCTSCGAQMQYEEIEVEYRGITGHIDYILDKPKGKQIIDFKTSSSEKILKKDIPRLVSTKYMMQILTYTYIVQELYGWNMVGSSLLFISRDTPDTYLEVFFPWDKKTSDEIAEFVDAQVAGFSAANKSLNERDAIHAIKNRLCKNSRHYQKNVKGVFFGGCSLAPACVSLDELQTIKTYLDKEMSFLSD